MSNSLFEEALKKWLENIQKLSGKDIMRKMIARRDSIITYAINFKKIIDSSENLINWPLKGCEDLNINENLKKCFDCLEP